MRKQKKEGKTYTMETQGDAGKGGANKYKGQRRGQKLARTGKKHTLERQNGKESCFEPLSEMRTEEKNGNKVIERAVGDETRQPPRRRSFLFRKIGMPFCKVHLRTLPLFHFSKKVILWRTKKGFLHQSTAGVLVGGVSIVRVRGVMGGARLCLFLLNVFPPLVKGKWGNKKRGCVRDPCVEATEL